MPRALHTHRFRSIIAVGFCFLFARGISAQGFDKLGMKKKITLHRKLPAVIHFTGTTFQVEVTSRDPKHADVAAILKDRLETELSKSNPHLQADEKSPELIITCIITSFDQPPDDHFFKNETVMAKGAPNAQGKQQSKPVEVPVQYKKIRGSLDVSYEARDRNHHTLDAKNVPAKYSEDFEVATNQPANKSSLEKMQDPFKRIWGKKKEEPSGPPSPSELRDKLVNEAIDQIVPRITITNEAIEVWLARGKLDEANKSAEGGLWTRYLEQLEQMTPFPKTKDDSYRLYDIGVAYEALAYQSESEDAAKKSLQEAAINYGKAVDAKPDEKNFLEPQKRIQTAMSYLRKLETERKAFEAANAQPAKPEAAASTPPASAAPAPPASKGPTKIAGKTPTKASTTASTKGSAATDTTAAGGAAKPSNGPAKSAKPPAEVLTNDKVIRMSKEKVDEASIIATIHDAPVVDFDLSVEGNIALTRGGVSSNVLAAMRARAKQPNHRTASPGST
jgi:hypothetical protein